MRAISSAEALNSIATTASEINSLTLEGPPCARPKFRQIVASAKNFTMPVVSPKARARPFARNGKGARFVGHAVGL